MNLLEYYESHVDYPHDESFLYMPLDPKKDSKFNAEDWVLLFGDASALAYSEAMVDLDTAKAILKHCDRLLNMAAFL